VNPPHKEIVIDLTNDRQPINESFLRMFGSAIEALLGRMFGINNFNFKVRGTRAQIDSFLKAMSKEASYIKAVDKYGLKNASTYSSKSKLERAVKDFERETGISWPFY